MRAANTAPNEQQIESQRRPTMPEESHKIATAANSLSAKPPSSFLFCSQQEQRKSPQALRSAGFLAVVEAYSEASISAASASSIFDGAAIRRCASACAFAAFSGLDRYLSM